MSDPLGLPQGSVRALIALILVGGFTVAFLGGLLTGHPSIDPKDYGAAVLIVLTAYFVSRPAAAP